MNEPTIRRAGDTATLTIDGLVAAATTVQREGGPLRPLLMECEADPMADHGTVHSGDGLFQASIPLSTLEGASLDGDGRMHIDDTPTNCWLVKDVRRIELTAGRRPDSLPPEERARV